MRNLELSVNQDCVSNPFGNDVAVYLIIRGEGDLAYVVPEAKGGEYPSEYGFEVVAKVDVTRPCVMWGSVDEVEADIVGFVRAAAVAKGICVENEAGTLFIA